MTLRRACAVGDIPPGSRLLITIRHRSIGIFNIGGSYYALRNRCPHEGAPLCLGVLTGTTIGDPRQHAVEWIRDGEVLRCPWHAWEFDLATGRTLTAPQQRVKTYPVVVQGNDVFVDMED
jgi:nitrite reductase/ring-hydroxylating ferredoxin subunit